MNRRRLLIASLSTTLVAPAFAAEDNSARSEKRAAIGFDRIGVAGPFDVVVRQGTSEGIELSGDAQWLALVETVVEGEAGRRSLRIGPRRDAVFAPPRPIAVTIDVVKLTEIGLAGSPALRCASLRTPRLKLQLAGSSRMTLPALAADRLDVSLGGSGHLEVGGNAGSLAVQIAGSADCALGALRSEDVSVQIAGSGSAVVQASRQLRVSIAGSGHVRHSGAAEPQISIVGSGDVRRV